MDKTMNMRSKFNAMSRDDLEDWALNYQLQVERLSSTVEEQQKRNQELTEGINLNNEEYGKIIDENVQLHGVLEFYADRKTWHQEHIKGNEYKAPIALNDEGKRARRVLDKIK
ncbi:hypothetical protein [Lederbergia lenta]|uniref:hypothetical protein n=1 Tax=Lederbergia lenta TaxID=1467 RepID=UPI0020400A45|nr:hypothetical protein [Lederbergia lenta]MCM3109878.1 hypothetical protein [Lederbergia lenta]